MFLTGGCASVSGESERQYSEKTVDAARAEAKDISSNVLDIVAVQGEVSEPGPGVDVCAEAPDSDRMFKIYHAWSLSGVPRHLLEEGMDRARNSLPGEGWEIAEDGEKNNANRSPRILFENREVEYAINMTLVGSGDDSLLSVSLVSACFSTPEGESPKGSY